jgi:hypothetical protein
MADTLIAKLGGTRPFEPKSGSFEERLYAIYNASKHAENKIASGTMPVGAPVPVWITNRGIECSEALVSFAELEEVAFDPRICRRNHDVEGGAEVSSQFWVTSAEPAPTGNRLGVRVHAAVKRDKTR